MGSGRSAFFSMMPIHGFQGGLPHPGLAPPAEVVINPLPRWEVLGHHSPLDAAFHNIQDGVINPLAGRLTGTPPPVFGPEEVLNLCSLFVGEVTWMAHGRSASKQISKGLTVPIIFCQTASQLFGFGTTVVKPPSCHICMPSR